jgi:serine/threonine protein kinase
MASLHADPPDLLALATSVARGDVVDWSLADKSTTSPKAVEALRAIDKIAALADRVPDTWGRLSITGELGHGAYGTVYAAHDPQLGIDVALKVVRPAGETVSGFSAPLHEARLLAQVNHPNVVRVFSVESIGSEVGISMELVHGRTLTEILRHDGPQSVTETIRIGIDVCRALGAVHAANLLHGDIKAGNVMCTAEGRTVLMDFGVGQDLKVAGPTATRWAGTPLYLAPEVFAGGARSRQSDIYSAGVLLYHLATDTYPIDARDAADVERHHVGDRPLRPLRDVRPDLPEAFVATVERAMARRPADRFRSAADLEVALDAAMRRIRKGPVPWRPLLAGAAAALLAGLVFLSRQAAPAPDLERAAEATTPVQASIVPAPGVGDGTYRIDVSMHRHEGRDEVRLAQGATVSPGDELSLRINASVPVYAYVVNEDDRGATYLLFPLPGQQLRNPLPPGVQHEIPGLVGGESVRWKVDTAGGQEHFVVVVSPEPPAPAFESLFASLPRPVLGAPVIAHPLSVNETTLLRGVGGLVKAPGAASRRRLSDEFGDPLPDGEQTARGVWVRQLTLTNPAKRTTAPRAR